ncbi:hypothetical protein BGZ58_001116 [Dissophora ornata]|nr:hypothetical protein BGZ58_001116 [Dissophora ornata]
MTLQAGLDATFVSLPDTSASRRRARSPSPGDPHLIRRRKARTSTTTVHSSLEQGQSSDSASTSAAPPGETKEASARDVSVERASSLTAEDSGSVFLELSPPATALSSSPSPPPQTRQGQNNIEIPDTISLEINLRYGVPLKQSRIRGGWPAAVIWTFQWDKDDLESLIHNVRRRATQDAAKDFEWPLNQPLYLKPNRNAPQANYLPLDPGDYEEKLRRAWRSEAKQLSDPTKTILKVFAYLTDPTNRPQTTSGGQDVIRRTSKARIQASTEYIQNAVNNGHLQELGAMATAHLARHFAKRPPVSTNDPPVLPQTATFRQVQHLDDETAALRQRNTAEREKRHSEYFSLSVTVQIKRHDLQEALGLPDMNLNGLANFTAGNLDDPENDMEDIDHLDEV